MAELRETKTLYYRHPTVLTAGFVAATLSLSSCASTPEKLSSAEDDCLHRISIGAVALKSDIIDELTNGTKSPQTAKNLQEIVTILTDTGKFKPQDYMLQIPDSLQIQSPQGVSIASAAGRITAEIVHASGEQAITYVNPVPSDNLMDGRVTIISFKQSPSVCGLTSPSHVI